MIECNRWRELQLLQNKSAHTTAPATYRKAKRERVDHLMHSFNCYLILSITGTVSLPSGASFIGGLRQYMW